MSAGLSRSISKANSVRLLTDSGPGEKLLDTFKQGLDSCFIFPTPTPPFSALVLSLRSIFGILPTESKTRGKKKNNNGWGGGERAESVCGLASTPLAHSPGGRIFLLNFSFQPSAPSAWSGPKNAL